VATLKLGILAEPGDVAVVTGWFHDNEKEGATTVFTDFAVSPLSKLFGPADGDMVALSGKIPVHGTGVVVKDSIAEARFFNPSSETAKSWSYGFLIRQTDVNFFDAVIVRSDGRWYHYARSGSADSSVEVGAGFVSLNTAARGSNKVMVVASGEDGWLFVNDSFKATLNLGAGGGAGQVSAIGGYFSSDVSVGTITRFEGFTVWSPETSTRTPTPTVTPIEFTKPDLIGAVTGSWWDTSKTTTDKTESTVTKAKNTSIRLDFAENLDGTSIQATDFTVAGITPLTAAWYSGNRDSVFLTVPALAPNARPKVELVAEVRDLAGNRQTTDSNSAATDGIAPSLIVMLMGTGSSRPVTTGKITIHVFADENVGLPTVTISTVGDAAATDTALTRVATPTVVLVSARTYKAIFTGAIPGLYNVYVTAKDVTASNPGAAGVNTGAIDFTSMSKALLFEIDTEVAAPAIGPANTDDPNTFITVDFAAGGADEGDEYTGTGASAASTNYDTHDTVTIVSATLDGIDITPLATTDNKSFLHKASGLTVGDHTVKVKAKDAAGNEKEFSGTVKVTAP
jgi:hypothetical protein